MNDDVYDDDACDDADDGTDDVADACGVANAYGDDADTDGVDDTDAGELADARDASYGDDMIESEYGDGDRTYGFACAITGAATGSRGLDAITRGAGRLERDGGGFVLVNIGDARTC